MSKEKPFFRGNPMVEKNEKWFVIEDGQWLEFAGQKSDIEWREKKSKPKKGGEYRVWFTRSTLKKDLGDLLPKERFLVLVMELWRDKKTNTGYPPFRVLTEVTGFKRKALQRLFKSLDSKGVYNIKWGKGTKHFFHFQRPLSSLKEN